MIELNKGRIGVFCNSNENQVILFLEISILKVNMSVNPVPLKVISDETVLSNEFSIDIIDSEALKKIEESPSIIYPHGIKNGTNIIEKPSPLCKSSSSLHNNSSHAKENHMLSASSLTNIMTDSFATVRNFGKGSFTKKSIWSTINQKRTSSDNDSNNSLNSSYHDTIRLSTLIVDDSSATRRMVSRMLSSKGYQCDTAEDGSVAVNMALEKSYDLILMDFVMPTMNGLEATRLIRNQGYKGLIYGLTGNGLPQDIAKFIEHGANRVFIKPLDIQRFLKAVDGNFLLLLLINHKLKSYTCLYLIR